MIRRVRAIAFVLAATAVFAGCGGATREATTPSATVAAQAVATTTATAKPAAAASTLPGAEARDAAVKQFVRIGKPIYCGAGKLRLVA